MNENEKIKWKMKTQNGRTQEVDILIRERKDKTNKKYSTKIEKGIWRKERNEE